MKSADIYVYVIAHLTDSILTGPVKVGVAASPISRLREVQTGNPKRLVLCAEFATPTRTIAAALEHAFHTVMADRRLVGEWFAIEPKHAVASMCANFRACFDSMGLADGEISACLELTGVSAHERRLALTKVQGSA